MKRQISVTLDDEIIRWLDEIGQHRSRARGGTIRQFLKLSKQAIETGETQIDPVVHVAFTATQQHLLQDTPDTASNILRFPGVAR
mgnify:FL=1